MTTEPGKSADGSKNDPPATVKPAAPISIRSPVERAIVWTAIVVLLIVAYFEFRGNSAFRNSWRELKAALEASEKPNGQPVPIDQIEMYLSPGFKKSEPVKISSKTEGQYNQVTYSWSGLLKDYDLRVQYGIEFGNQPPAIISFDQGTDPAVQQPAQE